jgi:ketosteroid isomerase-like protein
MSITTETMTDEQRRSVALEYLKRLDNGADFFGLFADDAQVFFPKWGLANGVAEIKQLFSDVAGILAGVTHDYAYFNYVHGGDTLVVEGTSSGTTADGTAWRAGVTHAGRWCDVFEIRDGRIQRLFIYLDPDYADADTARYPWLNRAS